jgi:carbonic anhydrase
MTTTLQDLFSHNRAWAAQMEAERLDFFINLKNPKKNQQPQQVVGCASDSRARRLLPMLDSRMFSQNDGLNYSS